jgi:hypothetical protein
MCLEDGSISSFGTEVVRGENSVAVHSYFVPFSGQRGGGMKGAIDISLFQVHPILLLKPKISHQDFDFQCLKLFVEDAQFLGFGLACLYPEVTASLKGSIRQ